MSGIMGFLFLLSGVFVLLIIVGVFWSIKSGQFDDLAFDSNDQLWGSYIDFFPGGATGIYRIDLNTMTATRVVALAQPMFGLAFAPYCASTTFCTPKTNFSGCKPTIGFSGQPSASAGSGFHIEASNVRRNRVGVLIYSANRQAALPLGGGLLCVANPFYKSAAQNSGGSAPPFPVCDGLWSIDFNAVIAAPSTPSMKLEAGVTVYSQWWGRDHPWGSTLSNGLEFTICE